MKYFVLVVLGILLFGCVVEKDGEKEVKCLSDTDCGIGGCSGEICGLKNETEGMVSICIYKPEYECLKLTTCKCIDGRCKWDENKAYRECIEKISKNITSNCTSKVIMPPSPELEKRCKEEGGEMTPATDERGCVSGYECRVEVGCVCYLVYEPVCGKDGKTYSNKCFAKCAGVEIDYEGECQKFIYKVKGCEEKMETLSVVKNIILETNNKSWSIFNMSTYRDRNFEITTSNGYITIYHNFSYTCCANITLNFTREENKIIIVEVNEGEVCKCRCKYNVYAKIGPLAEGVYSIEIYGVKYKDREPSLLLKIFPFEVRNFGHR